MRPTKHQYHKYRGVRVVVVVVFALMIQIFGALKNQALSF